MRCEWWWWICFLAEAWCFPKVWKLCGSCFLFLLIPISVFLYYENDHRYPQPHLEGSILKSLLSQAWRFLGLFVAAIKVRNTWFWVNLLHHVSYIFISLFFQSSIIWILRKRKESLEKILKFVGHPHYQSSNSDMKTRALKEGRENGF